MATTHTLTAGQRLQAAQEFASHIPHEEMAALMRAAELERVGVELQQVEAEVEEAQPGLLALLDRRRQLQLTKAQLEAGSDSRPGETAQREPVGLPKPIAPAVPVVNLVKPARALPEPLPASPPTSVPPPPPPREEKKVVRYKVSTTHLLVVLAIILALVGFNTITSGQYLTYIVIVAIVMALAAIAAVRVMRSKKSKPVTRHA